MGCATEQTASIGSDIVNLSASPDKLRVELRLLKNNLIGNSAAKQRGLDDKLHLSLLPLIGSSCDNELLEQALSVLAVLVRHERTISSNISDQRNVCNVVCELLLGTTAPNAACRVTGLHIVNDLVGQPAILGDAAVRIRCKHVMAKYLANDGPEGILAAGLAAELAAEATEPASELGTDQAACGRAADGVTLTAFLPAKTGVPALKLLDRLQIEETVVDVFLKVLQSFSVESVDLSSVADFTRLEFLLQAVRPYARALESMAIGILGLAPFRDSSQNKDKDEDDTKKEPRTMSELAGNMSISDEEPVVLQITSEDNRQELNLRSENATYVLFRLMDSQNLALRLAAIELAWAVNVPSKELAQRLLPLLVAGLDNKQMRARTACICAEMCLVDELSALMLLKRGYISRLGAHLAEEDPLSATTEKFFLVLAAVASHSDELRKDVYSPRAISAALRTLVQSDSTLTVAVDQEGVVAAACLFLRCLSRSVELLSTRLASEPIVDALYNIVKSTSSATSRVRTAALAVICNLIVECSPAQKLLLERGILSVLADSTRAFDVEQRINAVWALKHALYLASDETKMETMRLLGINGLLRILNDPSDVVVEQGLGLLRNFLFEFSTGNAYLVTEVGDADLALLLKEKLKGPSPVVETTLYVLVHLVMYDDRHSKLALWYDLIAHNIGRLLDSDNSSVQLAAILLVITAIDAAKAGTGANTTAARTLVDLLDRAGIRQSLQRCCGSRLLSVSERAFAAEEVFDALVTLRP